MDTLDELSEKHMQKLLPNIIWMFVCLFLGVIGNSLVLLVYRLRMETELNERYFIPILAFLDLLASTLSSLHNILSYMFQYNYPSDILCKFFNFGSFFVAAASAHTLLLIAIQRYRKICVPFGRQMDLFWRRVSFAILISVTLGYSMPVCFTSGLMHGKYECGIDSGNNPLFYKIFSSGVFLITVSNIVAVSVLYSKIGCVIYRHGRNPDNTGKSVPVKLKSDEAVDTDKYFDPNKEGIDISQLSSQENSETQTSNGIHQCYINETSCTKVTDGNQGVLGSYLNEQAKISNLNTSKTTKEEKPKDRKNPKEKKREKWNRTKVNFNKLFGAIIIFYLISYVPTMIILVGTAFGHWFVTDLNVFYFLSRMYIINNIVNPFIYGYFDFCFRHSVKSLLKCWK